MHMYALLCLWRAAQPQHHVFEANCRSTASGGLFSSSPALTGAVTSSTAIIKPATNALATSMVSQSSPVTAAGSQSGMASRPLAGLDSLGMRSQAKRSTLTIDQVLLLLHCSSGCLHTCSFCLRTAAQLLGIACLGWTWVGSTKHTRLGMYLAISVKLDYVCSAPRVNMMLGSIG